MVGAHVLRRSWLVRERGQARVRRDEDGFSMVELLVVLVIALILAALIAPQLNRSRQNTGAPQINVAAGAIWRGVQAYRLENGGQLPPAALLADQETQSPPGKTFVNPADGRYVQRWPDGTKGRPAEVVAGTGAAVPTGTSAANAGRIVYWAAPAPNAVTGWLVAYADSGRMVYRRSISNPASVPLG